MNRTCWVLTFGLMAGVALTTAEAAQRLQAPVAFQQSTSTPRDFVHKPVASLPDLVELVKAVKKGRLPERRLILKLQTGGVAFDLSESGLQSVAAAGASKSVLDVLRTHVKEPDMAVGPKTGNVIVLCEPVDCSITINGKDSGKSDHGKSQPLILPEGTYSIQASASKYISDHPDRSVALHDREQVTLPFTFRPSPEALHEAGKELFTKARSVVDGESPAANVRPFKAAASLQLSDRDGVQTVWGLEVLFHDPDLAKFTLTRGVKTYTALYKNGQFEWDKPPAEVASLEDVLMKICQMQLSNFLAHTSSGQFTYFTERLVPLTDSDNTLSLFGMPDSYTLTIDHLMHVKEIQVKSTGLNDGLRVLYGEYSDSSAGAVYPRVVQIVLPDRPRHGAEIQYSSLTYSPAGVSDGDFTLKHSKKKKSKDQTQS